MFRHARLGAVVGVLALLAASIGIVVATPVAATSVAVTVTSAADGAGTCPSVSNCTLRQALVDASVGGPNQGTDPTITITPGLGTITLVSTLDYDGGAGGDHVLTLIGNGATVAGNGTFGLLVDYTTMSLVIDGVTFTGGGGGTGGAVTMPSAASTLRVTNSTFEANVSTAVGGAVHAVGSTEFDHVAFSNNLSEGGGAVYSNGAATFTDVTFTSNGATQFAGAVFQKAESTYTRSTFIDNSAGLVGGAILANGTTTIAGSTFSGNSGGALAGGAVALTGAVVVTDSDFSENVTDGNGGALYVGGTATISRSRFTDNAANGIAGAIYAEEATTILDSTISDNASYYDGGALSIYGSLDLTGSTFSGNTSVTGEGAFWADGIATIVNSTLTANVGGAVASTISADDLVLAYSTITEISVADGQTALVARSNRLSTFASVITGADGLSGGALCNVAATSFGYNFASDSTCGLTATGDLQDQPVGAAALGDLLDNGGPTPTQLPRIASPLVGAIPSAACATGPAASVVTDQRGFARPNVIGGRCDIGAVQLTPMASATVVGSTVVVEVREFTSTATVTIHSDPVVLGTIAVDPTGSGRATFALPASVVCGPHEVVATASGGQIASTTIELAACVVPVFTG